MTTPTLDVRDVSDRRGRIEAASKERGYAPRGLTLNQVLVDWRAGMDSSRNCTIDGCSRKLGRYRNYCRMHYLRILETGSPGSPLPQRDLYGTHEDKFWRRVHATGVCWEWTGAADSTGYGVFAPQTGFWFYAHRWAWEYLIGPITDGMTIDHRCLNKACVNPDHLEVVTRSENSRRANSHPTRAPRKTRRAA